MLAATATERVHRHERPGVVDTGAVVLRVGNRLIRARNITQRFKISHNGGRRRVERDVFAVIDPREIASNAEENHVARHLLENTAGFNTLSGIDVTDTRIFISAPHTAGNLAIACANEPEVVIRSKFVRFVLRKHPPSGGLSETLGNIDVVPVGQGGFLLPVCGIVVNLLGDGEQRFVARYIV